LGGSGYTKPRSGLRPLHGFVPPHFFCACKNAPHFSLSGAKKRQLQPKRYMPLCLKYVKKIKNDEKSSFFYFNYVINKYACMGI
jgi:hypothetical protein